MKKILMFTVALAVANWSLAAIPPINGTNVVGFAAITAPGNANTIITVPFEQCLGDGASGTLADLVSTNGLTAAASAGDADQLVVLTTNATGLIYYYYWCQSNQGWTPVETSVLMPSGTNAVVIPPAATNFPVARGLGFWIKREASAVSTLYVKGQVSSAKQDTLISAGLNLVGYGTVEAFTLNGSGIDWTGAYGGTGNTRTSDKILVVNADGSFTEYFFFTKPAGSQWDGYAALDNKWITAAYTLPSATIPAGQGFWYLRRGAGTFNFRPDGL